MKTHHTSSWQRTFLLLALLLIIPQPVNAETSNLEPSPIFIGLMWPTYFPKTMCTGLNLDGYQFYWAYWLATNKVPKGMSRKAEVVITTKQGKVFPKLWRYTRAKVGSPNVETFSYDSGNKTGDETIEIKVTMANKTSTYTLKAKIVECEASLQFSVPTNFSYGPVSLVNNYFGSASLRADENGQLSGSGVQAIWGDIPPYTIDGATCMHSPPWEGSASLTFTGQVGEDGKANVTMEMDSLRVNASTLTCTGEGSGGMPFPAYTFSSCQVLLAGFNFESTTLDVPIDCPGEEPYILPITITARRGS